jgi:hypothetical protein
MALSLGGAVAPAATPFTQDANNPNIRRFNLTALDADTGPTAFNHGVSVPSGQVPIVIITLAVASGTTVVTGNIAVTTTQTQISISKNNLAGSATGLGTIAVITVWNPHTAIQ